VAAAPVPPVPPAVVPALQPAQPDPAQNDDGDQGIPDDPAANMRRPAGAGHVERDILDGVPLSDPHPEFFLSHLEDPFRGRPGFAPAAAGIKGADLQLCRLHSTADIAPQHPLSWRAVTAETHAMHLRWLNAVRTELSEEEQQLPLTLAIERLVLRMARARGWAASTTHRHLCSITGAFAALPMYTDNPFPVMLARCPRWRMLLDAARQAMQTRQHANHPAVSTAQMGAAIATARDPWTKAALILTWVTAARGGDTRQLHHNNVLFDPASGSLKITIFQGKTAGKVQPYTVPTVVPEEWREALRKYLETRRGKPLFSMGAAPFNNGMTAVLRQFDKSLGLRAIRRGAAQALAANPHTTLEVLMVFTGHRRRDTLLRYLGWQTEERLAAEARKAAADLAPPRPAQH
jgi:hypothetical protein